VAFLQGDVKVPGIKQPLPKWAVLGGLTATGIGIFVYYRNRQASAAPAAGDLGLASGDPGAVPGAGGGSDPFAWDGTYDNPSDPNSLDTATGSTFGDEGGSGIGLGPGGTGSGQGGPPFSSNQAWSAYVLSQDDGQHPNMAQALGLYLEGKTLDAGEQDLVYQAIAIAGPVPVNGPGGFPPALRTSRPGGKGGTTFAANPVPGLTARPGSDSVTISWHKADHATGYQVQLKNLTKDRNAGGPVTVSGTSHTFTGLTRGDRFEASVLARPAEKGAHPATITAAPAAPIPAKPKGK